MKHTAGKWTISGDLFIVAARGDSYVNVAILKDNSEREANALLIAAAPELLEALKGAEKAIQKALPYIPADAEANHFCGEWLGEIRAEIQKAEGK